VIIIMRRTTMAGSTGHPDRFDRDHHAGVMIQTAMLPTGLVTVLVFLGVLRAGLITS